MTQLRKYKKAEIFTLSICSPLSKRENKAVRVCRKNQGTRPIGVQPNQKTTPFYVPLFHTQNGVTYAHSILSSFFTELWSVNPRSRKWLLLPLLRTLQLPSSNRKCSCSNRCGPVQVLAGQTGLFTRLGRFVKEKAKSDVEKIFSGLVKSRNNLAVTEELLLYWNPTRFLSLVVKVIFFSSFFQCSVGFNNTLQRIQEKWWYCLGMKYLMFVLTD